MSVIVKGMEMPKNCWECSLSDIDDDYGRCCLYSGIACLTIGRQDNCPLVEIPIPHGRLIDADEPMTKISTMMQEPDYQHEGENWMIGLIMARDAIDDAPTVIEEEGSETDA